MPCQRKMPLRMVNPGLNPPSQGKYCVVRGNSCRIAAGNLWPAPCSTRLNQCSAWLSFRGNALQVGRKCWSEPFIWNAACWTPLLCRRPSLP